MELIYSAFREAALPFIGHTTKSQNNEEQLRMDAYHTVCKKYEQEIKDIKQWLPDWEPAFILKQ